MKKIFIAGCGRSGTSLMKRLFKSYRSCLIVDSEHHFDTFKTHIDNISDSDRFDAIIIKRKASTWRTLTDIPDDIFVLAMARHPFDVMTSYHPRSKKRDEFYISPERWVAETEALFALERKREGNNMMFVRYEDIVGTPDEVQSLIATCTGLEPKKPFTEIRSLSNSSVNKFYKDSRFLVYSREIKIKIGGLIDGFCERFNYDYEI